MDFSSMMQSLFGSIFNAKVVENHFICMPSFE